MTLLLLPGIKGLNLPIWKQKLNEGFTQEVYSWKYIHEVYPLATCARKPKGPGLSPAAYYVQR